MLSGVNQRRGEPQKEATEVIETLEFGASNKDSGETARQEGWCGSGAGHW